MKRMLAILLVLVTLLSVMPVASAAGSLSNFARTKTYEDNFTDVPASQWYAESVAAAYEFSLMKGSAEDKFNPTGKVKIAEALAMACRIHDIYNGGAGEFVQGNPWYQVYVDYAVENGILTFTPSSYTKDATRAEFAAILSGALPEEALEAMNEVDDGMIPDVAASNPHYDAIYRLYRAGILTGNDAKGTFTPDSTIQRSAAAAIVTRMADEALRQEISLTMEALSQPIEGSDVSWFLQEGTGTLYLIGDGTYEVGSKDSQPWAAVRDQIKAVVIGEDITEVADYSFYGCTALAEVQFPDGLKRIGDYAFADCSSFGGTLDLSDTKIKEIGAYAFSPGCAITAVSFPSTLTSIGNNAFARNKNLSRVDLSKTKLTTLEGCTFAYCSVTAVALPKTLERIEYQAFIGNCLERVVLPASVTYVGERAFNVGNEYSTALKEVYVLGDELPELYEDVSILSSPVFAKNKDYSHVTIYFGGEYFYKTGYNSYNIVDEYDLSGIDAGMPPYVALNSISLPASITLFVGEYQILSATFNPTDASDKALAWKSSNTAVATVGSNGRVEGKSKGTAVITATAANGMTATCTVTVNSSADYAYLVSSDFRSIRRDYPHAVAQNGYAYAYKDENGDLCVLTYVQYKIGSGIWSDFYLHNMSTGRRISDPSDYYDKQADRAFGATKVKYLSLSAEVLGYQVKCTSAIKNIIATGKNTENGAYVSAAIMNQ